MSFPSIVVAVVTFQMFLNESMTDEDNEKECLTIDLRGCPRGKNRLIGSIGSSVVTLLTTYYYLHRNL